MDVKTAFLNGSLDEEIYMQQPEGYIDENKSHLVCKLMKSLYGLKQGPRQWNITIDNFLKTYGFHQLQSDHCIYVKNENNEFTIIALYVDDMIIASNNKRSMTDVK